MVEPIDYHTFARNPEDILHDVCAHLLIAEKDLDSPHATSDALKIIGDALSKLMGEPHE